MSDGSALSSGHKPGLVNRIRAATPVSRRQFDEVVAQVTQIRRSIEAIAQRENLFSKIENFLGTMEGGWCTAKKAHTLASIIVALRPALVLEIGVWTGRSLIPMALACRENKFGKVIGIDPYKAVASVDGQNAESAGWWSRQQIHDDALKYFRGKVAEFDVEDYVDLHVQPSDDVEPPYELGLLHVDGNHGPQALRDVERFAPRVHVGGFVVLDDIGWSGGAVSASVASLLANGFVHVRTASTDGDDWAMYQRRSASA